MPEQRSYPASSPSPPIPGVPFPQPGWVTDAWEWAGMGMVARGGCYPWACWRGDGCRGIAAVCSPSPAASELGCIWQTQSGICYFGQCCLSGGGERHREHTQRAEEFRAAVICRHRAKPFLCPGRCHAPQPSPGVRTPQPCQPGMDFSVLVNVMLLLLCLQHLMKVSLWSSLSYKPCGGSEKGRMGWLPPGTIPL